MWHLVSNIQNPIIDFLEIHFNGNLPIGSRDHIQTPLSFHVMLCMNMICTCYVLWSQMLYFWFSQYKWLDSNKILIIYEHNSFCFFIAVILHHLFFTTYLLYTSSILVVTSQLWSCWSLDHLWLVIVGVSKTMLCIYWCMLCPEHCFTFTFTLGEFGIVPDDSSADVINTNEYCSHIYEFQLMNRVLLLWINNETVI